MNIIVDTNVLFAALIRNSETRKLILSYNDKFLCPEYFFIEFEKHKLDIFLKSGSSYNDFDKLYFLLMEQIYIVPHTSIKAHIPKAVELVKDIDEDDILFIATALAYPKSILWSNDAALRRQNVVHVMNTKEIRKIL